jgi:hypothetical protein
MKRSLLLATAAALLMATSPASAFRSLYKGGAWQTYITTSDSDGKPLCGMSTSGNGATLHVKYTSHAKLFIQIFQDGWSIPPGTAIPGYLIFDKSEKFPAIGTGYKDKDGQSYVEFTIKSGTEIDFMGLVADADKLIVGFDQGTQNPYRVNMTGSRMAAKALGSCADFVDALETAPQPFAKHAPQPFDTKPQPFNPEQPAKLKDQI